MLTANLVGRVHVHEEVNEEAAQFQEEPGVSPTLEISRDFKPTEFVPRSAFTPEDAFAWIKGREIMTRSTFNALSSDLRGFAFTVARVTERETLATIRGALERAIETGDLTRREFVNQVRDLSGLTKTHLETVFTNNLHSAYNAGRRESQFSLPSVKMLRWKTVGDSKVREEHRALEGFTAPKTDPFWKSNYPPAGHRCRCIALSISDRQVRRSGIKASPKSHPARKLDSEFAPPTTKTLNAVQRDMVKRTQDATSELS